MLARGFKTRCENISLQLRRELGFLKTDPLPYEKLAENLSVLLLKPGDIIGVSPKSVQLLLGRAKNSWSAVTISFDGFEVVIYNSSHSRYRQSNNIMHELSHILLRHEPSKIIVSPNVGYVLRDYNEVMESEASWLAGCLLLPREALLHIKRIGISTRDAQRIYEVSGDLLQYRFNITGVNFQTKKMFQYSKRKIH
jgi:Zn-dependent peptidase ImmA (M78 family)